MVDTDDTRQTTNDGRRTTPRVWHKLPTGELKNKFNIVHLGQEKNVLVLVIGRVDFDANKKKMRAAK